MELWFFRLQHVAKVSMVQTAVPVQVDTRPRALDMDRSDYLHTPSDNVTERKSLNV